MFANLYLHTLDSFIKNNLKIRYYGRYVDDLVLIHTDREVLTACIGAVHDFLSERLRLSLHPDKIVISSARKGLYFLGVYIKPYRTYIGNRMKNNMFRNIYNWKGILEDYQGHLPEEVEGKFIASINSYMGIIGHFSTYQLRKKIFTDKHFLL